MYIGIDGDDIGAKIERCFLEDDEKGISFLSCAVQQAVSEISEAIQCLGFKIIFSTGDSILARGRNISPEAIKVLLDIFFVSSFTSGIS